MSNEHTPEPGCCPAHDQYNVDPSHEQYANAVDRREAIDLKLNLKIAIPPGIARVEADRQATIRNWIIPTALIILAVSGWCIFQIIRFYQPHIGSALQ